MAKAAGRLVIAMVLSGLHMAAGNAAQQSAEQFDPQDLVVGSWWLYKSAFVEGGRVVDRTNGAISHSEGQGYGMLLAVAAGDRETFDAIWDWTRRELYIRGDKLAAWKWDPNASPNVTDTNNASDGDLLIAWALMRGGEIWKDHALTEESRQISKALVQKVIRKDPNFGTILLPAAKGFSSGEQPDGPVINLSYWIFPAIRDLAKVDAEFPARQLIESGTSLLGKAKFGPSHLPSDWLSLKEEQVQPARNFPARFGYDAVRIPLYAAWFGPEKAKLLTEMQSRWAEAETGAIDVVDLATGEPIAAMTDPGYQAVRELLACGFNGITSTRVTAAFEPTAYYPSTLHLVSLVAISERYLQCAQTLN